MASSRNTSSGSGILFVAVLVGILLYSFSTGGNNAITQAFDQATGKGAASGTAAGQGATAGTGTADYFTATGAAQRTYDAKVGKVNYCAPDAQGRPVCAYGLLTSSLRAEAQSRGRQDITVNPTGWPAVNPKVTIAALPGVDGSKAYSGWMWNRSHLLADSLGGDPIAVNLVTGTRTQNVGSTQEGGMAYTETIARDYLDSHDGNACPLCYAATPNYSGTESIPRTVTVDIQSCDKSIDQRIEVVNAANGWTIDYSTAAVKEG